MPRRTKRKTNLNELPNVNRIHLINRNKLNKKQIEAGNIEGLIPVVDKENKLIRFVKPIS
ncbi:MAG: hypothetical protein WC390_07405 [Sulfurimonas sp.]|jgi:hypothetical protein